MTGLEYDSSDQGLFNQLCQETSEYDHVILTDIGECRILLSFVGVCYGFCPFLP